MSSLKLNSSGGGSVTLTPASTASNLTATVPAVADTLAVQGQLGLRNKIINGAMMIDQRNAGAAQTINNTTAYSVDRWAVNFSGGSGTAQRVTGSGSFQYALRLTGGSGVTSGFFSQKIESYNIADCASSTVTYSIRLSSSIITSLTWYARYPNSQDNYSGVTLITSGTVNITSTPTNYTFQIALPSQVTNGLEVYFTFGSFTSGTIDITGVQLEKGATATPFENRLYGTELALCQRYLPAWTFGSSGYVTVCQGQAVTGSGAYGILMLPVQARVIPTGIVTTGTFCSITASYGVGGSSALSIGAYSTTSLVSLVLGSTSGLVAGNSTFIASVSGGTLYCTGCEL